MGCPAKKVAATGCGAALIRTPDLAREIIRAACQGIRDWRQGQTLQEAGFGSEMIEQIDAANRVRRGDEAAFERRVIPLSVKTRLGYDRIVIEDWLTVLLAEKPAAISLHGRTLEQGYKGDADWNAIARAVAVARGSGTVILGNGDVQDLQDAYRRVCQTGVDGVLIGRSAQGDPWIFREKDALKRALRRNLGWTAQGAPVGLEERFRVMVEHGEHFERLCGRSRFMAMRKHLTWYCRHFRGAAEMRARMGRANSAEEVRRCFLEFLTRSSCEEHAHQLSAEHLSHAEFPSRPDRMFSCG
jgi:tRNA-dihydrouridine synthase